MDNDWRCWWCRSAFRQRRVEWQLSMRNVRCNDLNITIPLQIKHGDRTSSSGFVERDRDDGNRLECILPAKKGSQTMSGL